MRPLYSVERPWDEPVAPRVLLHQLDGAMDAGHAGRLAVEQLLMTLPSERLATFDADSLIDYRARRPMMVFDTHSYRSVEAPELVLDLLQDDEGRDLLLLHGAEPDYRWEEVVGAVTHLALTMGVTQAVAMAGMPMAVPHTRPTYVHHHGNRPELLPEQPDFFGRVELPGSMSGLLELRLGQAGLDSRGLTVSIPHYVARDDYPAGAAALLSAVAETTGLALPLGDLEAAAAVNRAEIDAEASSQPEVAAVVAALEAQYDTYAPPRADADEISRLLDVPTADEIGARLEAFLEANDAAEGGTQGR
ncbi:MULTISPECIES: PAC2 family protein [unclassified Actinomyces]|uniref:proteasome assembly chaperone family protein n=1 Tax=unclassified Actinomyces TaxID=2609248 RepID=UPI0020175CC1|nr:MULTISPECIES: PAC2 family protein [unclassified Actinomyces]MCL3778262.1 PAC2 family protein [Actinomyces sp. AC-20-1]MCL3790440.1 PAC2 family protein [Actinomyces sp. 187325]MCL3792717.1 PAC2 family protein [Actinomyces sp. 186855]MCL3795197.1 PAC2 family protein [Actinomyces sp. 217892]